VTSSNPFFTPEQEARIRVLLTKKENVRQAAATLRSWAEDARTSPAVTSGNAVAQLQTIKDRLGVFFDRFADLIESQ